MPSISAIANRRLRVNAGSINGDRFPNITVESCIATENRHHQTIHRSRESSILPHHLLDIFPIHCYDAVVARQLVDSLHRLDSEGSPLRFGITQREILAFARRQQGTQARLQAECARSMVS